MKSLLNPALRSSCLLTSLLLVAAPSACATPRVVVQNVSGCSALVPQELTAGVPAPDLPAADTVGEWVAFGDAAVGKLDQANRNTVVAVKIVQGCEARDKEAAPQIARPWWKVW